MDEPAGRRARDSGRAAKSRYSRFVSLMKFLLPAAAAVLFISLFIYSGFFDRDDKLDITFRDIATQNDDLRMVSPRVSGLNNEGRPYELIADTATQDTAQPNLVRLENITADMKIDEADGWLTLNAARGLLDTDRQTLNLDDKVDLFTTQGYEFHASTANVNFDKGTVESDDKVWGQGPMGTLRADSMSADNTSETINFRGRVKATIYPGGDAGPGEGQDETQAGTPDDQNEGAQ